MREIERENFKLATKTVVVGSCWQTVHCAIRHVPEVTDRGKERV